ncbi:MAG TPA: hypothetical protein VFR11_10045 [Micromonosporaceae bacterium]|jgi:hypothetical protein|nr:hypothetical protein [Micromonosporaceae bacterium]
MRVFPVALLFAAALAAIASTLLATIACLVPAVLLRRIPAAPLLAAE